MNVSGLRLETRTATILGAAAGGLLLLALVWALYVPVIARIGRQRRTLTELRVKIDQARQLAQQPSATDAALEAVEARHRALQQRVMGGQSLARILESLSAQAKDHRLEFSAVQPEAEDEGRAAITLGSGPALREVTLTLHLNGRYRQFGEFLATLPQAPYLASVRRLTITRPVEGGSTLPADVALAVYVAEHVTPLQ